MSRERRYFISKKGYTFFLSWSGEEKVRTLDCVGSKCTNYRLTNTVEAGSSCKAV